MPETTLAAEKTFQDTVAEVASFFVRIVSIFIWVFLSFIGALMNNDLIFNGPMQEVLRLIWIVVRNLTNVAFAIILIGASFYVVLFGGGEGGGTVKGALPKFILGLVLVNFSWLGCQVVLDVSSVVTSAIFAIPQSIPLQQAQCVSMFPDKQSNTGFTRKTDTCYNVSYIKVNQTSEDAIEEQKTSNEIAENGGPAFTVIECSQRFQREASDKPATTCVKYGDLFEIGFHEISSRDFSASNAAMIMAVNLMSIQNLPLVSKNLANKKVNFTINVVFSLFMIIMVSIPIVVLFFVLLARMLVIWICMAFMPLAFLGLLIQGRLTTQLVEGMPDIVDQFIKNAFLPAYVAAPFSIGFLMLNAAQQLTVDKADIKVGDTYLSIQPLIAGVGSPEAILWYIAVAGIIWMGVFTAMKGNDLTEGIVSDIQGKAQEFGKFVGTSAKYLPFMPVWMSDGDKKGSPAYTLDALIKLPKLIETKLAHQSSDRTQKISEALGIDKMLGIDGEVAIDPTSLKGFMAEKEGSLKHQFEETVGIIKSKPNDKEAVSEAIKSLINSSSSLKSADQLKPKQVEHLLKQALDAETFHIVDRLNEKHKIYDDITGSSSSKKEEKTESKGIIVNDKGDNNISVTIDGKETKSYKPDELKTEKGVKEFWDELNDKGSNDEAKEAAKKVMPKLDENSKKRLQNLIDGKNISDGVTEADAS